MQTFPIHLGQDDSWWIMRVANLDLSDSLTVQCIDWNFDHNSANSGCLEATCIPRAKIGPDRRVPSGWIVSSSIFLQSLSTTETN